MEKINDGGPAFGHGAENGHCCGMTIRDYFAGQALVGILATGKGFEGSDKLTNFAKGAYQIADAMIAERERNKAE